MTYISQKFGRYTLTERLAQGGMGEIYLASIEGVAGFEKQCVIKKIRYDFASDDTFVERFLNEGKTLVALTHSNIVQIFDMGEVNGEYYLAMEYIAGADLRFLLKQIPDGSFIPVNLVIAIILDTLKGLSHAHLAKDKNGLPLGIVHRDISPSNILISENGEIKLIDFGIAKARTIESCTGLVQGKFAYMSPEQARGESLDPRTDIFSLGIVLYEMLTGVRPFEGNSDLQSLEYVKYKPHRPIAHFRDDIDDDLESIVSKALEKDKANRYASADAFYDALDDYGRAHGYKAGQREITAYFKPWMQQNSVPSSSANMGINDVLDAMLNAQALSAPMTRTQTITPQKTHTSEAQENSQKHDMALANTGTLPIGLDDTLSPTHPSKVDDKASSTHPSKTALRSSENIAKVQSSNSECIIVIPESVIKQDSSDALKDIKTLAELPSSDLAIIEEADLISDETKKQLKRRKLMTRMKYALVGAFIMLVAIFAYILYFWEIDSPEQAIKVRHTLLETSQKMTQQSDQAEQKSAIMTKPQEMNVAKQAQTKHWLDLKSGLPFVFQTNPQHATIYVVEGNYHNLNGKSVVLKPGKNVEIAIQAPGYESCFLKLTFKETEKVTFESMTWQNCASTYTQFSVQDHQLALVAQLTPIRADRNDVAPMPKTEEHVQSEASTTAQVAPKSKPVVKKRINAEKPAPQMAITHHIQTSHPALANVDGATVQLPGNLTAKQDTKIKITPKVSGKTVAIPQIITWNNQTPDNIAFCNVKIRIRESYVPGDPAPYQIADIFVDGKPIAKQTDFASIILPCGEHQAEAKIQAGNTALQGKTAFSAMPNKPLTLPITLKP